MDDLVEIRSEDSYAGVYARTKLRKGALLLPLKGLLQPHPTRYTIQIAPDRHIGPRVNGEGLRPDEAYTWCFLNHSCNPNTCVDVEARAIVALREISAGEELTFNYNTTEWSMVSPFACHCGRENCYGQVRGFKHLSPAQQHTLLPLAAPHIQQLYSEHLQEISSETT